MASCFLQAAMKHCLDALVHLACHPAVMQAAPEGDTHGLDAKKRAANMQSAIQKLLLCHDKHAFGAHAALKVGQLPHQIRRHVECTNRNAQRKCDSSARLAQTRRL